MTNDNNLDDYIQVKFIQFVLHNDYIFEKIIKEHVYDNSILNINFAIEFVSYLKTFVAEAKFLTPKVKDKAYRIIEYIKENNNFTLEEKSRINEIFNDAIIILNIAKEIEDEEYYLCEIVKRFNITKDISIDEDEYENYKGIVEESMGNDYIILTYHSDLIKEKDFEEEIDLFKIDMYYFNSLNAILSEYPEILENETFRTRVKKIIDLNKKHEIKKSNHTSIEKKFIQRNTNNFHKLLKK